MTRFARFAWGLLVFNLAVILWGAYVRATGAGAGCGSHWPLCNGEILPRAAQLETLVEFTHRLTSGLALVGVVVLLVWAWRAFPRGHAVRKGAVWAFVFIITEALLGAALVLFRWVALDTSLQRIIVVPVHLVNTFLLLAALSLTAWQASGGQVHWPGRGRLWGVLPALLGVLFIGASGAITALGDTLFPVGTLAEGLRQDFAAEAHLLIRLRFWHPVIAVMVGMYLLGYAARLGQGTRYLPVRRLALLLGLLVASQWIAGVLDVLLLAPVWLQLVHLLLADLVWVSLILLTAAAGDGAKG